MKQILTIILITNLVVTLHSQIIDKVIAVIGNNVILYSDIENQRIQSLKASEDTNINACHIFEELVYQNLLLHQAELDSITISDTELESELNRRMRYFSSQIGGEKNLEAYFNKSIYEIKADLRGRLRKQMIADKMQNKLFGNIKITPSQVREYYYNLHPDSIPIVGEQVEYQQIVMYPSISEREKAELREKLNSIRERIVKGENFATMAILYSDDPGSAMKGGELGFINRNELLPEFAAVVFKLKEGEVSQIIETEFGYHIIQVIERRGELINLRHILLAFKSSIEEQIKVKLQLENVLKKIKQDSLKFGEAARKYSADKSTSYNEGIVINPYNNSTKVDIELIDNFTRKVIDKLNAGEISDVFEFYEPTGKKGYKIIRVINKYPEHKADLKNDYQIIQQYALNSFRAQQIKNWIKTKLKSTYFYVDSAFSNCTYNLLNF
ncbi:MAG: peptidylprolyl isomerase [Bacteroidales bacterium]|nr:peptidylprolyl isomerase [Bacteroidales bacterium]